MKTTGNKIRSMGTTTTQHVFFIITEKDELFEFMALHPAAPLPKIGDQITDWLLHMAPRNDAAQALQDAAL